MIAAASAALQNALRVDAKRIAAYELWDNAVVLYWRGLNPGQEVTVPVAVQAGIDPVYFGVIFVMTCAIGLITPPVGLVLNVVAGVSRIDFLATARGVLPFLLAEIVIIGLLLLFPQLLLVPAQWLY